MNEPTKQQLADYSGGREVVEPTTIDLLRALQRIERNLTLATASAECPRCGEMVSPRGRSWSVRDMAEYGLHAWHPVGESPWLARRRHRKSESPMARSGRKVGEL
ncbi:MAG: hypothetical protein KatS3mg015_2835 [Fimbriimonadales bacterium]|nr:MAG: hypothetical protein KatS3mg015_2835 [Fimbriimonadales bacterium]